MGGLEASKVEPAHPFFVSVGRRVRLGGGAKLADS